MSVPSMSNRMAMRSLAMSARESLWTAEALAPARAPRLSSAGRQDGLERRDVLARETVMFGRGDQPLEILARRRHFAWLLDEHGVDGGAPHRAVGGERDALLLAPIGPAIALLA